jgi:hypothetical protein
VEGWERGRVFQRPGGDRSRATAQASVELLAALPALALALLLAAQIGLAGYALWSAGIAARAGARSGHVGGSATDAARRALPPALRRGARVNEGEGVRVRVFVPRLVPWLPKLPVEARTALEPGGSSGG